ncbi:RNA polymerase sporulation-specific sigma factor [Caldicoprobacter guelmensis]|uniref:RNA polymerase sporulation sigma factor SigF n=1 Tax=Caldicoprobacter guelmensis TaxID=1170224 RepID=UPI00195B21E5|nr:RNA polymerase sporulation sigma factor SigF [Caldicoprobacter guelmensis]MBM7581352.1 RNA polymerase sporulation-specific sigma factor [Caldicoprobacter guelmensis]
MDTFESFDREKGNENEILDLIVKAQGGDEQAKEELVKRNIALVKSIVKRFLNRGYEYEDLFQIGVIGLIKAINNYDPKFNVQFSTYAVPMIMGEIKRFLRDDGPIKVSRSLKELASKVQAVKEQLESRMCREPTIHEVAREMGISPEELVHAMEANRMPSSIYDIIYEDDDNPILLIDKIHQDTNQMGKLIDRIMLKEMLAKLDRRERAIIVMRYFQDRTQSDIANELGISQVQVSRIEKKVLLKMREML